MAVVVPVTDESLSEERKRTGRYAAIGTAIFLTILACYEALNKGTWPHAALFGSALIMFVYVLWVLYASNRARSLIRIREATPLVELRANKEDGSLQSIDIQDTSKPEAKETNEGMELSPKDTNNHQEEDTKESRKKECHAFVNRSYSIA